MEGSVGLGSALLRRLLIFRSGADWLAMDGFTKQVSTCGFRLTFAESHWADRDTLIEHLTHPVCGFALKEDMRTCTCAFGERGCRTSPRWSGRRGIRGAGRARLLMPDARTWAPSGRGASQPAAQEGRSCACDQRGGGDAGECGLGPGVMGRSRGGQRGPGRIGRSGGLRGRGR